jgi:tRNA A-37 threonylcarbamoyl transferase component Bud32
MRVDNYIASQYRELLSKELLDPEFAELYGGIENANLREILASLHKQFLVLFKCMNERLPTGNYNNHFWADPSRSLIFAIDMALSLQRSLKNSNEAFDIDNYNQGLFNFCQKFLQRSGGSTLPENMDKIELYYTIPIFTPAQMHKVTRKDKEQHYQLKLIGEGSYAQIFKYTDEFYNKDFALKRAKKNLVPKERERFKREFEQMLELSSPYILEVYAFDETQLQYTMEFMDFSLDGYLQKYNSKISLTTRRSIAYQVLKAFNYLHSKKLIHRDISPKNVLLKEYDDILVVKISDFGLVKTPTSLLTSANTEFKGYYNDPALATEGFDSYSILHETYALTKLLFYIMTGKTNTSEILDAKLKDFIKKGLHADNEKRFQNINELTEAFRSIYH